MATGVILSFYSPEQLEARLKEAASRDRRTLSSYIRVVLEDRLNADDQEQEDNNQGQKSAE